MSYGTAELGLDIEQTFSRLSTVPLRDRGRLFDGCHVVWDQTERARVDPEYRRLRARQRLESYHRNKDLRPRFVPERRGVSALQPPDSIVAWVHAAHPEGI